MKTATDNKEIIRQFLIEKLGRSKKISQVADQESLIANGMIDSLGILQLVSYIERRFNVKIRDEEIIPENFESVDVICSYIERLQ